MEQRQPGPPQREPLRRHLAQLEQVHAQPVPAGSGILCREAASADRGQQLLHRALRDLQALSEVPGVDVFLPYKALEHIEGIEDGLQIFINLPLKMPPYGGALPLTSHRKRAQGP